MPISTKALSIRHVILLFLLPVFFWQCKEKSVIYGVEDVYVTPINSEKNKPKSQDQYIAILYANLFQQAMSPNQLLNATRAIASVGDKQVAYEILVSKFMNNPAVILPSNEEMRKDIDKFLFSTYERFLVRRPTEAERTYLRNYIESHPNVTPEHIFVAFSTCNEYYHY